ncbi:MAG: hypothetical protein LBQ12_08490 [Deltaproteobacteria bacterium]|jgi:hypothetical protein|nr:hypothetical protein [Deltaproteobacteria bacterium]
MSETVAPKAVLEALGEDVKIWKQAASLVTRLSWEKVDVKNPDQLKSLFEVLYVFFDGAATLLPRCLGFQYYFRKEIAEDLNLKTMGNVIDSLTHEVLAGLGATDGVARNFFIKVGEKISGLDSNFKSDTVN